jgi:hypothetical protein
MSLIGLLRIASVAVPIGLGCGGALAQQIVAVPTGAVVLLVPGTDGLPANAPEILASRRVVPIADTPGVIERIFAQQQSIMDHMMADMNALFTAGAGPEPGAPMNPVTRIDALMDRAWKGFGSMPVAAGGSFCAESMTVTYPGNGRAPVVKVSHAGNGCGPVTAVAPAPARTSPTVNQPRPSPQKLYEVNDPVPMSVSRLPRHT